VKQFPDLSVKIAVCTGQVRRFAIGDPAIQIIDTLAGATIARLSLAEQQAKSGDIILDQATTSALGVTDLPGCSSDSGEEFSILDASRSIRLQEGVPLHPATPEGIPQVDPETLKPWVPPLVYERETAGHQLLLTELRPTTALFIRFTGIDYDDDPGARDALNAIVSGVQRILKNHEGSLLELTIGDKGSYIYASLGATHIHEDDPQRAIRAALEIKKLFGDMGDSESLQIGISSGTMRVGGYGGGSRKSFSALGNGVNLAARLMTSAAPGEILVSGRVQKAGAGEFAFEARPPMTVKGRSEPILVFAVLGLLHGRAVRLREPTYSLPLIGRQKELVEISSKLEAVLDGKGQIVGITGDAGMGKSRLAAEGIRMARRSKLLGYGGACQSDGINTPYLVWNPIWNAFFNLDPATPLRRQVRTIEGELEDSVPEHVDALPLLGAVLGLPLPESDFTRSLLPSDRKAQLETVLVKCLQYAAKEAAEDGGGVLMVLEDLHWIDPVSFDLLALVARAIRNHPVLILLTYRPPEVDAREQLLALLRTMNHFTEINLTELNPAESGQAIRAKLVQLYPEHRGGVPPILIQRITDRAQGNPFYLEELLNYMHDRGIDPHDLDALKTLELPNSLHSLILSRIDHLTASQQLALKVASIIGRIFRFDHLHRYYPSLGAEESVKFDLMAMERLDLIPMESPEPDLTYLFKHLVTHEVGYECISYATRAKLHGQYASFLEALHPDQIEKITPTLAHHYDKAGIHDKALIYLIKAGEQAAAQFANEEALAYFNRALTLAGADRSRQRFDTLMKRERVFDLMGKRREQRQDLDELAGLANGFEDSAHLQAQLALRRAKLEIDEGDYQAAKASARTAIQELTTIAQAGGGSQDLRVDALWLEARAMFYAGETAEARPQLEEALSLARTNRYIRGEYNALAQLGIWHWSNGDFESAVKLLKHALDLIRKAGDIRRELDMLINLGIVTKDMYRFAESRAHYEEAQRIAGKIGDRSGEASLLNNMGRASIAAGDFVHAIAYCTEAVQRAAEVNEPTVQGLALHNLSEAYREFGQYHAAHEAAEASIKLLHTSGYPVGEVYALENLALIEFSLENHDQAFKLAEEALSITRKVSAQRVEVSVLTHLGLMRLGQGQIDQAAEVLNRAKRIEDENREDVTTYKMHAGLASVALARGGSTSVKEAMSLLEELAGELLQEPPSERSHALPLWLYLACLKAFEADEDPRTGMLISRAKEELRRRSEKIPDADVRADYLAIPEHKMISELAPGASAGN
jgi:predicted ATPase/class 3 adenylate cyclase